MRDLPSGTVTFLFTDIEGSTRLLAELGEGYADALAAHRRVLREAFARHGGVEVDTQGDAFFVAFADAAAALMAAEEAQRGLSLPVRMGLHTGEPQLAEDGYVGLDVHRAARICAAAHGGQVVVSEATRTRVEAELRPLGAHRLKDLAAPEPLYQLGEEEFPPLRSLNQSNLPVQPTPFLGRERELADVLALLADEKIRLLTLTGPGGSGKTRLALQAAAELVEKYPHGVWWVPLQALREPELILPTVASTLGAKDDLAEHLAGRRLLLLLDNFEQVVEAASAVAELLRVCPDLRLLATSREPLRIAAEQQYQVPPLAEPEAIGFFAARARAVDPSFESNGAAAEICRRLDGLPLALELAAARVKAFSPEQLLARLDRRLPLLTGGRRDAPERQRTLRATIEWSCELLLPKEHELFGRLSVFAGGWMLEAAEKVAEADLETLESLVDKSLIRRTGDAYAMLETVREYAGERLADSGERDAVVARLVEHLLSRLDHVDLSRDEPLSDTDNWRVAVDWAIERGGAEAALKLTGAARTWRIEWPEVVYWTNRALAERSDAPPLATAHVLSQLAIAHTVAGKLTDAVQAADRALLLHREHGSDETVAAGLLALAQPVAGSGDFERAERLLREALPLATAAGDTLNRMWALHGLGEVERDRGRLGEARKLLGRAIELARVEGYRPIASWHGLGDLELEESNLRDAAGAYAEALAGARSVGAWFTLVNAMAGLAAVAAAESRLAMAGRLWGAVEVLEAEHGVSLGPTERERYVQRLDQLDAAALAPHVEAGRALLQEEAIEEALSGD